MKVMRDEIEVSPETRISWSEVETLRLLNDKLILVLENGTFIELSHLNPSFVDHTFRIYEQFLRDHPEKKRKRKS